jgi:hypothetical protein
VALFGNNALVCFESNHLVWGTFLGGHNNRKATKIDVAANAWKAIDVAANAWKADATKKALEQRQAAAGR